MLPICILAIEEEDDREFMAQLFINYHRLMYATIQKVVTSGVDTEDVMQATLVKLIDKISVLRGLPSSKRINYVISACKNTALNANRDYTRHLPWPLDDVGQQDATEDVFEKVIHNVDVEALYRIWDKLDERSRFLLQSKYILEMDDAEIAAAIGVKAQSVRMYLSRARKQAYTLMDL